MRKIYSQEFPKNVRLYHNPEGCLNSCCQGESNGLQAKPPRPNWESAVGSKPQPPTSDPANETAGRTGGWGWGKGAKANGLLNPTTGAYQIQPRVQ